MKIFSAAQMRSWDAYSIAHEPILSIDLMERASRECFLWLTKKYNNTTSFMIFCGPGNNGGDGLALARMLHKAKYHSRIFITAAEKRSADHIINLERLVAENIHPDFITDENKFPTIPDEVIVVDAIFGTGLSRPIEGLTAQLIKYINLSKATTISIDLPSGLLADNTSDHFPVIKAEHTLSFQTMKLAFLVAENESYVGDIHSLDIGLQQKFYKGTTTLFAVIDKELIRSIYKPRNKFAHKYNFGHALFYTGSKDMMGAAILSAKACLRSGAGLVTVHSTVNTQQVIQVALPEAITSTENELEKLSLKKTAIGIGPGLEATTSNSELLQHIMTKWKGALVIDATALDFLSSFSQYLLQTASLAILTPHTGEFEKLFGKTNNDFERIELALHKASTLNCYIVLKGHYSFIACPDGRGFFNKTGNAGMATAGSGDVLTGIITGLVAQGYTQEQACLLGVYLHGSAGDIAADRYSQESMIAGDIIDCLGEAFKKLGK